MRGSKPILLVEDDAADVMIVKHAFNDLKITNPLVHASDGEEALEYLKDTGNKRPIIILLDLNMPRMNGFEFLKIVKADESLKKIPVIVLTTSDADQNIVESYELAAAGYIVKPVDYKQFVEAIKTIDLYWTLSKVPNGAFCSASF